MAETSVVPIYVRKPVYSSDRARKQDLRPIQIVRSRSRKTIDVAEVDGVRVVNAPVHPTEPDPVKFGA